MTNRRNILRSLGTASAVIIGGVRVTSASQVKGRQVGYLGDKQKKEFVRRIKSDSRVRALTDSFGNKVQNVDYSRGIYSIVSPDTGADYYNFVIPYTIHDENTQAVLAWTQKRNSTSSSVWVNSLTVREESVENARLEVVDDEVLIHSFSDPIRSSDSTVPDATTQSRLDGGGGGGAGCVYFYDEYCEDFNLSCVLWLTITLGLACGSLSPVACLAGAGVNVGEYLTGDACEICDVQSGDHRSLC